MKICIHDKQFITFENDDYMKADLLKAIKQNPYTKPIGSVA